MARVLPHDKTAEEAVISSMLIDQNAIVIAESILRKEDFYSSVYGVLFQAMCEMNNDGIPPDIATLKSKLQESELPDEFKSLDFLKEILMLSVTSANIKHYADIVAKKSRSRQYIKFFTDSVNACYEGKEPIDEIIGRSENEIYRYQLATTNEVVHIADVIDDVVKQTHEAAERKSEVVGIPTGYVDLDRMLSGLMDREYTVIAARPAMGKTALILNIIENIAVKHGIPVAVFSLEMDRNQLARRLLAIQSRVKAQNIKTGQMEGAEWKDFEKAAEELKASNIYIDDLASISVSEIRAKCRKLKMQNGIRVAFIDYIQLIDGSKFKAESRRIEVDKISSTLRRIARELEIPVVAVAQLSRGVELRSEKRPGMADLRESGQIEQDANNIIFIYRDYVYNPNSSPEDAAELIVAKSRDGKTGTVNLKWLPEQLRFVSVENDEPENDGFRKVQNEELPFI